MSTVPKAATVFSTPAFTCSSLATSMATAIAVLSSPSSRAAAVGGIEVEIGDDDAAAGLDVALGDAVADAAGGAGDQRDFSVEPHDACSFPGLR